MAFVQTNRKHKYTTLNWPLPSARQARKKYIDNKIQFKTKLFMYNTKDDVALTNISRETSYIHDFVKYPKKKFLALSQPQYVIRMFLNFGNFSASCFCTKKVLVRERIV